MHPSSTIRLLVADDHPIVRDALSLLVSTEEGIEVVAQAASGEEALRLFREQAPDVVVMDLHMPGLDGLQATETLCREFPDAKVIILSFSSAEEDVYRAFTAGAKAYLLKEGNTKELICTIRSVMAGNLPVSPRIAAQLGERLTRTPLTPREQEVLGCMAAGMSNVKIGVHLFITEGTVKRHVDNILVKLEVTNRTTAAVVALKRGLLQMD